MASTDLAGVRAQYADAVAKAAGLRSRALYDGLAHVPREAFLGPGPWQIGRFDGLASTYEPTPDDDPSRVYVNAVIALDASRNLNNGEPAFLARCLDALDLAAGDRFVHIGCGTGYYTAVASHAIGASGSVVAVEVDARLAEQATQNLAPCPTVTVVQGNGSDLDLDSADAIFVNAGATRIRARWLSALAPNGRMLLPLTVEEPQLPSGLGVGRLLKLVRKPERIDAHFISTVGIFHCVDARDDQTADALRASLARGDADRVTTLRTDAHEPQATCWLHAPACCLST